ncbi:hypothetical protein D3C74_412390 [compost metagenome]
MKRVCPEDDSLYTMPSVFTVSGLLLRINKLGSSIYVYGTFSIVVTSPPLKVNFCPTGVKSKLKSVNEYKVSLVMVITLEYVFVAP